MALDAFQRLGWVRFARDDQTAAWATTARAVSDAILNDPETRARWTRCGGTWFAGVNVFPNDPDGSVPERGVPPLAGAAVTFARQDLGFGTFPWDNAQISVCWPGYPQPWEGESDAAFGYRRNRDAAHIDGLARDAARRRTPSEAHGFILGLPLSPSDDGAAPFVVWEGSHEVMRAALADRLAGIPPAEWTETDVTDAYVAARKHCFETCPRVAINVQPGEAYVVHRLALHGVAPWQSAQTTPRMIAYFRPDPFPDTPMSWWLDRP